MAVVSMISVLLNSLLLLVFIVHRRELLLVQHNKILMALLLTGCFIGLTGTVNWLLIATSASLDLYKMAGMIPMFSFFFASVSVLCILTCDQLIAVIYPLRYAAIVTTRRINMAIFSAFAVAVVFALTQISIYETHTPTIELKVRGFFLIVFFLVGMTTLIITNYQLYKAIRYQRQRLGPLCSTNARASQEITDNEAHTIHKTIRSLSIKDSTRIQSKQFKTGRMCIFLVIIYVFSWPPLVIYRIIHIIDRIEYIPSFRRISMAMAMSYQIFVPCFYLLKISVFRTKLKNVLFR